MAGFFASITSLLNSDESKKEDPLVLEIKKGIYEMNRGENEKAEVILHAALKMAKDLANEKAQDYIYVILGDNALELRDFEKAEKLYKEVIRRLLSNGRAKEDDESIVELSLQLASIYAEAREFEKAEEGFSFCKRHQVKRVSKIDIDNREALTEETVNSLALYGMILDWYSKFQILTKQHNKALETLKEAYKYCVAVKGEKDEHSATILSDMAVAAELCGRIEDAIEYLKKAIEIAIDTESINLSTFYYNLGMCYLRLRDPPSAGYCCRAALKYSVNPDDPVHVRAKKCIRRAQEMKEVKGVE